MVEERGKLSSGARHSLPDSAFAYIEPGHDSEKVDGKTPDKYRHYPVHDAAHARNALARAGQGARFAKQAMPKILSAAKKFGIQHDSSSDTGRSLESLLPEVRYISDRPELRTADDASPAHIVGYASVFGKVSRRLGNFHEKVMPTAFEDALRHLEDTNVVCRYNHKDDMVLGTSQAKTLLLDTDERGLKYDVTPPRCRADVMEYVQRGDVRYSSFAFRVAEHGVGDSWGESDYGLPLRSLHSVELVDVAPVLDPAYKDTSASARNLAGAIESLAAWVDADPAEVRSMLEAGQASRFFRRTDRPSLPKLDVPSAESREESRVLDDPAVALRRWTYAPEQSQDQEWTALEQRTVPDEEELRAAMKNMSHEQLCQRWVSGEPCVRPDGHDGEHAPLCWARKAGMPCHKPMGHDGDHEPMHVMTRDNGDSGTETRSTTLTGPEAMRRMFERKKNLTQLPEE